MLKKKKKRRRINKKTTEMRLHEKCLDGNY